MGAGCARLKVVDVFLQSCDFEWQFNVLSKRCVKLPLFWYAWRSFPVWGIISGWALKFNHSSARRRRSNPSLFSRKAKLINIPHRCQLLQIYFSMNRYQFGAAGMFPTDSPRYVYWLGWLTGRCCCCFYCYCCLMVPLKWFGKQNREYKNLGPYCWAERSQMLVWRVGPIYFNASVTLP